MSETPDAVTSPVERLVMLQRLTESDVTKFEFISETPAGGMAYYSNDLDVAAIIYKDYMNIYHTREIEKGKTASCFSESIHTKTT